MNRLSKMRLTAILLVLALFFAPQSALASSSSADLNGDGIVNSADLAILLYDYGKTGVKADINHDGIVSAADLASLLYDYGTKTHSEYYVSGVAAEQMFDYFAEVVLNTEYGGSGSNLVRKWAEPIYYRLDGEYSASDKAKIEDFAATLNGISGFAGMYEAGGNHFVNLPIHFYGDEDFDSAVAAAGIFDRLNGMVTFWLNGSDQIINGEIYYRNSMTGVERESVILEEIYNGLGPINDTEYRMDSIIYQYGSDVTELSEIDLAILKLLYSADIKTGMDYDDCLNVIMEIYY